MRTRIRIPFTFAGYDMSDIEIDISSSGSIMSAWYMGEEIPDWLLKNIILDIGEHNIHEFVDRGEQPDPMSLAKAQLEERYCNEVPDDAA